MHLLCHMPISEMSKKVEWDLNHTTLGQMNRGFHGYFLYNKAAFNVNAPDFRYIKVPKRKATDYVTSLFKRNESTLCTRSVMRVLYIFFCGISYML